MVRGEDNVHGLEGDTNDQEKAKKAIFQPIASIVGDPTKNRQVIQSTASRYSGAELAPFLIPAPTEEPYLVTAVAGCFKNLKNGCFIAPVDVANT